MSDVSIANTTAAMSGKTVLLTDTDATVTALHTFSRSTSAPFAVNSGAGNVANLDADKLDGLDGAAFLQKAGGTMTGDLLFTDASYDIGKSGATRPRDVFASRNAAVGGTLDVTGAATVGGTLGVTGAITATAGQIVFPATQNASANANTLDDYEEGTWASAPVLGGATSESGQAYTNQVGRYIKVGKIVTAQGRVTLSTKGTITGNVVIKNLPFTAENVSSMLYAAEIGYWANMTTAIVTMRGFVRPNTTQIELFIATGATATLTNMATGDLANTTDIVFSVTYRADA